MHYRELKIDQFMVGRVVEHEFQLDRQALDHFVTASGDAHPLHTNLEFARSQGHDDVVLHGMLIMSRCSAFVASNFIGTRGMLLSMSSDFIKPGYCGQSYLWRARVTNVVDSGVIEVSWDVLCENVLVQRGSATTYISNK
jgi:itaconyl-CoA hydratase